MTLDEFIEKLKTTPREGWTDYGALRRNLNGNGIDVSSHCDCPLTAVARLLPNWSKAQTCGFPIEAGAALGMRDVDTLAVFNAADSRYEPLHLILRQACGL